MKLLISPVDIRSIRGLKGFLVWLKKQGVPFLVIGGMARAFHHKTDVTGDLDIMMPDDRRFVVERVARLYGFERFYRSEYFTQYRWPRLDILFYPEIHYLQLEEGFLTGDILGVKVKFADESTLKALEEFMRQASGKPGVGA